MSIETFIQPISQQHSIKEAVISLFLANPIIKPERFQELIEGDFKDKFQKFESVNQFEFQFQNTLGKIPTLNQQMLPNVGFKFSAFDKGQTIRVLQGMNEKVRSFVSYHELGYTRWDKFYKEYSGVIETISKFHPQFFVTAISLHYIDQFLWIRNEEPINLRLLFNDNGNYIPKEFFKSPLNNQYSIITEKREGEIIYLNRLDIKVESNNMRPMVTISHNVTQPLNDTVQLSELTQQEGILNNCHSHNKTMLFDILTEDVKKLINLKIMEHE